MENSNDQSAPSGLWILLMIIVLGIIITGIIIEVNSPNDNPEIPTTENSTPSNTQPESSYAGEEALVLIAEADIYPGESWTTPYVDYKFKLRTDGHAYNALFSGMSEPVQYSAEGQFYVPSNAQAGRIVITAGTGETKKFHIWLYKKVMI